MKRREILENRKKSIKFLQNPKRKKAKEYLDIGKGKRCCIGHGCYVLGVKKIRDGYGWNYGRKEEPHTAPFEFMDLVGLYTELGSYYTGDSTCLTELNDNTNTTPQEIGNMLEKMIEGGIDTPFRPLTDYEV